MLRQQRQGQVSKAAVPPPLDHHLNLKKKKNIKANENQEQQQQQQQQQHHVTQPTAPMIEQVLYNFNTAPLVYASAMWLSILHLTSKEADMVIASDGISCVSCLRAAVRIEMDLSILGIN
jgi:hypothetical protein